MSQTLSRRARKTLDIVDFFGSNFRINHECQQLIQLAILWTVFTHTYSQSSLAHLGTKIYFIWYENRELIRIDSFLKNSRNRVKSKNRLILGQQNSKLVFAKRMHVKCPTILNWILFFCRKRNVRYFTEYILDTRRSIQIGFSFHTFTFGKETKIIWNN